jgi:hypothetical protein
LYLELNRDFDSLEYESDTIEDNVKVANRTHTPRNKILLGIVLLTLKISLKDDKIYIRKDDRKSILLAYSWSREVAISVTTSTRSDRRKKSANYHVFAEAPPIGFFEGENPKIVILDHIPHNYQYNNVISLDGLAILLKKLDRTAHNDMFF